MASSMSIHDIEKVKIATRKFEKTENHDAYTATDYMFVDKDGQRFVITAFSDNPITMVLDN